MDVIGPEYLEQFNSYERVQVEARRRRSFVYKTCQLHAPTFFVMNKFNTKLLAT